MRSLRRGAAAIAVVAVMATLTGGATANAASISPEMADFGEVQIGTVSAPQSFQLSVRCQKFNSELFLCESVESLKTSISASPPFAVQSTDCPSEVFGFNEFPSFCTIKVVLQPDAVGPVTGTLSTGGPTAKLLGSGSPIPGVPGGSPPPAASPPSITPAPTPSPTVPTPPSNLLVFAKPKLDKSHGTATLTVTVPGPGTLAIAGKDVAVPRAAGPVSPLITVQAPGQVKLRIQAKGKAKKTLGRTGKVTVKASVTFTPTGGTAASYNESIHLVKRS